MRGSKIFLVLAITLIMLLAAGCKKENKMGYDKVLFIGIDGADPDVLDKLMQEGKLPNFQKLKDEGSYERLDTSLPAQSPVAWTSIATGMNPGKHNIFDFIRRDPKTYLPILSLAKSESGIAGTSYTAYVKAKPFFQIASENNVPATVIKWPLTFPSNEYKVEGNLLAGLGVPDMKGLLNSYRYYSSEQEDLKGDGAEKVIKVEFDKGTTNTMIGGPRKRESGKLVDITVPMEITLTEKGAALKIQGKNYLVNETGWSEWIRIKFNAGFMTNVYGICRAYLESKEPFRMYLTSVQIDPESPIQQISYPKKYSAELAEDIGTYNTMGLPEDTNALNEKKLSDKAFIEQTKQIEEERTKMFWKEFERFDKGILAVVFDTSDRIQHMYWDNKEIYNKSKSLVISKEIEDYFTEKDKFIGQVMEKIDNNTALIIASDHGFTSFERCVDINTWLYENGYLVLTKKPSSSDAGELFRYADWEKTKAYSLGFGSVYINLKGREGKGIVEESERKALVDEITSKLEQLKDEKTGMKAIIKVHKTAEEYSGKYVNDAPDMIIGFAPGYRIGWENPVGGASPEIIYDNDKHWRGDHIVDPSQIQGVFISNFKINTKNPSQLDIAPTILKLVKVNASEDIDGKSLV